VLTKRGLGNERAIYSTADASGIGFSSADWTAA